MITTLILPVDRPEQAVRKSSAIPRQLAAVAQEVPFAGVTPRVLDDAVPPCERRNLEVTPGLLALLPWSLGC